MVKLTTLMELVPDSDEFCDEVAVIVAIPRFDGVKTPEDVIVPSVAAHVTAELYDPVPRTIAVQLDVCVARIAAGVQVTDTDAIADCAATVTVALPDLEESSVEEAVIVAVPVPDGVKRPALLTVPTLAGLTDHVTDEL